MVDGVGLGPAESIEASDLLERRELLLDRGGDAVVGGQLADRAVLTLRRWTVVAPDVEDQRVLAVELVELVDDPPDLSVTVLTETGQHLHQARLERFLVLGDAVPGRHLLMRRRELRLGGNPAFLLGALEHALTIGVPTVVELALVPVSPFLGRVVRAVQSGGRPVHEQRLVRLVSLLPADPADRVVRQILLEVVALFRGLRRRDIVQVSNQRRLPARCLGSEESVEVLEAEARGPVLERAGRAGLLRRRVMPLAPRARGVAVVLQNVRHECTALGNPPVIAFPVIRKLGDDPEPHPMMIPPGQQ